MSTEELQEETSESETSLLDLNDEDFANLDESEYLHFSDEESTSYEEKESVPEEENQDSDTEESELPEEEEQESEESESSEEESQEEESDELTKYKKQLDSLLGPIKANGRDITVDNVDDARNLMQMGLNYNKKMAALKPNMKILKTLENNGLLDEDKINYLIDLENKNPEAVKRLIQEAKLDLDEYDPEEKVEYSPKNHAASDQQVELDNVLERIQGTAEYQRTTEVITKEWDDASKQELAKSPQLIETLNTHIGLGVYDRVMAQVAKEQALGSFLGLSDFQAYHQVGARMTQEGKFNDIAGTSNQSNEPMPLKQSTQSDPVDAKEAARTKRKLAIKTPKATKTKSTQSFNPLAMSDEEFEKLSLEKYL